MINKFKIYFLALIINLSFHQLNSQEPLMNRSNATNHTWLQKLSFYDINIDGSPYFNENFKDGTVILDSLSQYSGKIRIDAYAQKFQTLNKSGQIFEILIDDNDYVKIGDNLYSLHKFENADLGEYGILRECISLDNIKLYFFPRKRLKKPIEASRTVANSGYGKTATPEWIDDSTYLIFYQGKYTKFSQNHKKFLQLGLVKEASYKSFRKKSKINLKNERDLIKLVHFISSEV